PIEAYYARGHEERGQNFGAALTREPVAFSSQGAAVGMDYKPGRLGLKLIGRYADLSFDNATDRQAGAAVMRSEGDRRKYASEMEVSYDLSPNHRPFIRASYAKTDYPNDASRD